MNSDIYSGNKVRKKDFIFDDRYLGKGYAYATKKSEEAVRWAWPLLKLETTYTGKTLAAMLDFIQENKNKNVLFWNTYNSCPFPQIKSLKELPEALLKRVEEGS